MISLSLTSEPLLLFCKRLNPFACKLDHLKHSHESCETISVSLRSFQTLSSVSLLNNEPSQGRSAVEPVRIYEKIVYEDLLLLRPSQLGSIRGSGY